MKQNIQNKQKTFLKLAILLKVFYWSQNLFRPLKRGRSEQKIVKLFKK